MHQQKHECVDSKPEFVKSECVSENNEKKSTPSVGGSSSNSSKPNSFETKFFYKIKGSEKVYCNDDQPIGEIDPELISKVFTKSVPKPFWKNNKKSEPVKKVSFVKGVSLNDEQDKFLNDSNGDFIQRKLSTPEPGSGKGKCVNVNSGAS